MQVGSGRPANRRRKGLEFYSIQAVSIKKFRGLREYPVGDGGGAYRVKERLLNSIRETPNVYSQTQQAEQDILEKCCIAAGDRSNNYADKK
jgi:hypothetical protein